MVGFLRKHLFIVLGVSLPLLLVLFVFVIQQVARWGVPAPLTPVLYLSDAHYGVRHYIDWSIHDGLLKMRVRVPEGAYLPPGNIDRPIRVALFDPRDDSLELIELPLPEPFKGGLETDVQLPSRLRSLRLSDDTESPDGYRFQYWSRRSGGLVGDIFGFGGRSGRYQLVRDGVGHDLPRGDSYSGDGIFIAWVINDDESN